MRTMLETDTFDIETFDINDYDNYPTNDNYPNPQ